MWKRLRQALILVLVVLFSATVQTGCRSIRQRSYRIGIVSWVGYAPLFVAQETELFRKHGLSLEIRIMDGPGEREAAYLAGALDFLPNTPDAFLILSSRGATGRLVTPLDESYGADGLVVRKGINSVRELRGRRVGFQSGITSNFFLLHLLQANGLRPEDIVQESLGAGDAAAAFFAGRVDAAVTWEPWLTKARAAENSTVLATSRDTPGLLADILLVSDRVATERRSDVIGFIKSWFDAVAYIHAHPQQAAVIVARAFKLTPKEVLDMLDKVHLFSESEALSYFGGHAKPNVDDVFQEAETLYRQAGIISGNAPAESWVDRSFLSAVLKDLH